MVYLSRKGYSRNPVNFEEVESILNLYGVEVLLPKDYESGCLTLTKAKLVIGVTGSALQSIVLCQPGTKVLEIIPTDMVHPCVYTMSYYLGLDYHCILADSLEIRDPMEFGPSKSDIYVNPLELKEALNSLTAV